MGARADLVARVAPPAPPCFESRLQWVTYLQSAAESQKAEGKGDSTPDMVLLTDGEPRINPRFAFCRDCTAIHSDQMLRAGKCKPRHLVETCGKAAEATA